ncbi:MAG: DUF1080 domain-containing protein [Bryobacterales bacterium]|nr:DUF1080 domain-containing protein [Bryobacterales bacterium]
MSVRCLALIFALAMAAPAAAQESTDWIQLFNGKDLSGWTPKIRGHALGDNFGNTFRVVDGALQTGYEAYGPFDNRFGHIFYERPFSYYRLAVEYRFIGEQAEGGPGWAVRNSGLMLHSQSPESMGIDQTFPVSIEVQLLGGGPEGERPTANLCTPGTHVVRDGRLLTRHCTQSTSKTYRGEGWVHSEVLVLGSAVFRHYVEGDLVLAYELPQIGGGNVAGHDPAVMAEGQLLDHGYISLQSESHPIEFRKIELLDLAGCMDPEAKTYRDYFVKSEPSRCEY